jgi:tetratricopeptide (TPR) repeat protein
VSVQIDPMVHAALRRGIHAVNNGDLRQGLAIFSSVYDEHSEEPVDALSHYGLCLAVVERKYKPAIRMCQRAMDVQFYNTAHYANATRVLIAAGNRRRAVEVLDEGLKRHPKDPLLLEVRQRIGWRRGSVIPFLGRDNPVNVYLGRRRAGARRAAGGDAAYAEQQKRRRGALFWAAAVAGAMAYIALLVGIFAWIIE